MHDHEGVRERGRVDGVAGDRVRVHDVQRSQVPGLRSIEDADHVEAGRVREAIAVLVAKVVRTLQRHIAGQHVRQQAHVRGTVGVHIVAQQGKFRVRQRKPKLDQLAQIRSA